MFDRLAQKVEGDEGQSWRESKSICQLKSIRFFVHRTDIGTDGSCSSGEPAGMCDALSHAVMIPHLVSDRSCRILIPQLCSVL